MCLTSTSLEQWVKPNASDCGIPIEDMVIALQIYSYMWPKLDNNRRYCLNPNILAAELLERAGVGTYPQVRRFIGEKRKQYDDTISYMWMSAYPHGYSQEWNDVNDVKLNSHATLP